MKKGALPIKSQIISGVISGLMYAIGMALFDYFKDKPFSFTQFLIYFLSFGFVMSFVFRYKYAKE